MEERCPEALPYIDQIKPLPDLHRSSVENNHRNNVWVIVNRSVPKKKENKAKRSVFYKLFAKEGG